MLERARSMQILALALLAGCGPTPTEVAGSGHDAGSTGATEATTADPPGTATAGTATGATMDGTGTSSDTGGDSATTVSLDGATTTTTTTGEPETTSGASEGPGSSSEGGMEGSTTGEPEQCHPILAEVLYDAMGENDQKQWVRLYNPCTMEIELDGAYVLAWGGPDYTYGQHPLEGSIAPGGCRVVGGPNSSNDNANPVWGQNQDLDPDLQASGGTADGVALFVGVAADVMVDTVPVDAVIYGGSNDNGLLDASGQAPTPHVGDVGQVQSIRRTSLDAEWEEAPMPTPNECPAL